MKQKREGLMTNNEFSCIEEGFHFNDNKVHSRAK